MNMQFDFSGIQQAVGGTTEALPLTLQHNDLQDQAVKRIHILFYLLKLAAFLSNKTANHFSHFTDKNNLCSTWCRDSITLYGSIKEEH